MSDVALGQQSALVALVRPSSAFAACICLQVAFLSPCNRCRELLNAPLSRYSSRAASDQCLAKVLGTRTSEHQPSCLQESPPPLSECDKGKIDQLAYLPIFVYKPGPPFSAILRICAGACRATACGRPAAILGQGQRRSQ